MRRTRLLDRRFEAAADGGGITQLHRVVEMVNSGHSTDEIKQWCEKEIAKKRTARGDA